MSWTSTFILTRVFFLKQDSILFTLGLNSNTFATFGVTSFRRCRQSQSEAFLWASPSKDPHRVSHPTRWRPRAKWPDLTEPEETQSQCWCPTGTYTATVKWVGQVILSVTSPSPLRWRAEEGLHRDWATTWRKRRNKAMSKNTQTTWGAPPVHHTQPSRWGGSPVTPTHSTSRSWAALGLNSKLTQWKCPSPTRCIRLPRGLWGQAHSRRVRHTQMFCGDHRLLDFQMTRTSRSPWRTSRATRMSRWRQWKPGSPNPPEGKMWVAETTQGHSRRSSFNLFLFLFCLQNMKWKKFLPDRKKK